MITYGVCDGGKFDAIAMHGLNNCAGRDVQILRIKHQTSIHVAYNALLDAATGSDACVLIHDDVEIRDPDFEPKVLEAVATPDVAIVGVVGAIGVRSLAWWEGELRGRHPDYTTNVLGTDYGGIGEPVDSVDGLCLIFSPWAIKNLRFDTQYEGFHGYDADICFTARAAGRTVITADLDVVHHTRGGYGDINSWRRNDVRFRIKWGFLNG